MLKHSICNRALTAIFIWNFIKWSAQIIKVVKKLSLWEYKLKRLNMFLLLLLILPLSIWILMSVIFAPDSNLIDSRGSFIIFSYMINSILFDKYHLYHLGFPNIKNIYIYFIKKYFDIINYYIVRIKMRQIHLISVSWEIRYLENSEKNPIVWLIHYNATL